MLKLDGARRAASRICSRVSGGIFTGSKTFTALLWKIAIEDVIHASLHVAITTYVCCSCNMNLAEGSGPILRRQGWVR